MQPALSTSPTDTSSSTDARAVHASAAAPPVGGVGFDAVSLALGVAGLLPILPLVGSLAALVLGWMSPVGDSGTRSRRAQAGMALGLIGLAAPLVALLVYCLVLGYPFP